MENKIFSIPFLEYASKILGETNKGFSTAEIISYCNSYSVQFNVEIPITSLEDKSPNKRTTLFENLKEFDFNEYFEDIKRIFKSANWSAYLKDDEKLKRAFENSLYLLGAFENDKLIAFIRCVGDGEHILLIQDLIVDADYYRQGIGTKLFKYVSDKYKDIRTFCLFTDIHDVRDNEFYKSVGMVKIEEKDTISYIR